MDMMTEQYLQDGADLPPANIELILLADMKGNLLPIYPAMVHEALPPPADDPESEPKDDLHHFARLYGRVGAVLRYTAATKQVETLYRHKQAAEPVLRDVLVSVLGKIPA